MKYYAYLSFFCALFLASGCQKWIADRLSGRYMGTLTRTYTTTTTVVIDTIPEALEYVNQRKNKLEIGTRSYDAFLVSNGKIFGYDTGMESFSGQILKDSLFFTFRKLNENGFAMLEFRGKKEIY